MIGEQRYEVTDPGKAYRLSDGTELSFLGRGSDGVVSGVSVEEVISVLIDRLEHSRKAQPKGARLISLAITDLESAENWMCRWDAERRKEKQLQEQAA